MFTMVTFLFFTALVAVLTWFLTRGRHASDSTTSYFLAGRALTGGYIAGSLMLTNLSTEQLVGLNGAAFSDGICVMAWEVIAAASLVIMALFFLPRYLRSGIATVPQFLELRFDRSTRSITTIIFIIAYAGILLPIILYTGATGLSGILNVGELTGIENPATVLTATVWLIGVIGSIYAIFGGLRAVAVSDTLNGFGLLVGGVMITYFGLMVISGEGVWAGFQQLKSDYPEKFNSVGSQEQSVPFGTLFTGVLLLNLFYWTTNQQIIQRTFGASSLKEGQKGVLFAGVLKVLSPLILVMPGIIAYHQYHSDGIQPDQAYGTLVRNVLPGPLAGFFAAAMVGAILSSFNSALNSTATLFSLGVYQKMIHPAATEAEVIRSGKWMAAIVAVAAMIVAPMLAGQTSIFAYLQKMNGLYFIPIFAVVLMGMWSKWTPAIAANLALVVGFVAIAAVYFVPQLSVVLDGLHEFHFLGLVFAALIALMWAIRLGRPRAEPWEQVDSGDVDLTPWKLAWPFGVALLVFVLFVYGYFADFSVLGGT